MISDVFELERLVSDYERIPKETEKIAVYNGLDLRSTLRLRLLAEEMICVLPQLLIYGKGSFWIESEGTDYELHLSVEPYDLKKADREKILSMSKSGKNAAAVGIIGRIASAAEKLLAERAKRSKDDPYKVEKAGLVGYSDSTAWSLNDYRSSVSYDSSETAPEVWNELEKSIIANLSDDVIVGVKGGKVTIVVKKKY